MGVVYKAQDLKLDRHVALKFLPPDLTRDPEAKQRFIHEAKAASALQHDNICTIHDVDEAQDGQLFICMDFYDGETLKKKIERGPLPIDEAVGLAMQVARGLAKAHEAGMVHRDIKPANIMVTKDGEAKIVDFGLAKLAGQTKLTKTGSTLGTVAYMSPEQARGEEVDHRSDIWSLGAVLYEIVTGKAPFAGDYEQPIVYCILSDDPEPITSLRSNAPMELERIVRKALRRDRNDRYQHVDEMVVDLQDLKDETTRMMHGDAIQGQRGITSKESLWIAIAVVAVLVAAGVLILAPRPARLNENAHFRLLQVPFSSVMYPSLSRDGNWVAFPAQDNKGTYDVYWVHASGGEPRRLTNDSANMVELADISPDGSQIVYDRHSAAGVDVAGVPSVGGLSWRIVQAGQGPKWREDPGEYALWSRVFHIPDEELWRTHERRRERLVAFARTRLRSQLEARGAPPSEVEQAQRRFSTLRR
jgi:hypothetical protein